MVSRVMRTTLGLSTPRPAHRRSSAAGVSAGGRSRSQYASAARQKGAGQSRSGRHEMARLELHDGRRLRRGRGETAAIGRFAAGSLLRLCGLSKQPAQASTGLLRRHQEAPGEHRPSPRAEHTTFGGRGMIRETTLRTRSSTSPPSSTSGPLEHQQGGVDDEAEVGGGHPDERGGVADGPPRRRRRRPGRPAGGLGPGSGRSPRASGRQRRRIVSRPTRVSRQPRVPKSPVEVLGGHAHDRDLARQRVVAAVELAPDEDPGADAHSQGDEDAGVVTLGGTPPVLAENGQPDVVLQDDGGFDQPLEVRPHRQVLPAPEAGHQAHDRPPLAVHRSRQACGDGEQPSPAGHPRRREQGPDLPAHPGEEPLGAVVLRRAASVAASVSPARSAMASRVVAASNTMPATTP